MSNQFQGQGFATVLPRTSADVYRTLAFGQQQIQADKEFQARQQKQVEEHNYKVFKDFAQVDFGNLDGIHKSALREMTQGWADVALSQYNQASKNGLKLNPAEMMKGKQDILAARDIMMGHQEAMKQLNSDFKASKGLFDESMLRDAMSMMFVTDEKGQIDTNQPNLNFKADDILSLKDDPKYWNREKILDDYVKEKGTSIRTQFSTFKDGVSGEFLMGEEKQEFPVAIYGANPEFDDNNNLIIQDPKAWLTALDSPEVERSLEYEAKKNGTTLLEEAKAFLRSKGQLKSKGADFTRIAQTKESSTREEKNYTIQISEGSEVISDGNVEKKGEAIVMTDLVKGVPITTTDGTTKDADFQSFEYSPSGELSMMFTTKGITSADPVSKEFIPIDNSKVIAQIRSVLPENSSKRRQFEEGLEKAKDLKINPIGYTQGAFKAEAEAINNLVREGNFSTAMKELKSLGVEGIDYEKNTLNSNYIIIDGEKLFTKGDKDKITSILQDKIKQANPILSSETPDSADDL